jgi:phage gpG-like protein
MIQESQAILVELESQVRNMDYFDVLTAFQETIAEGEAEAFHEEREPGGSPWAPLAPSTVKKKGHNIILFETGTLLGSLVTVGGPGNVSAVSSRGSIFGTDVPYAIFHDQGTSKMPARPPVGISEERVDLLAERIADETVRQLASGR